MFYNNGGPVYKGLRVYPPRTTTTVCTSHDYATGLFYTSETHGAFVIVIVIVIVVSAFISVLGPGLSSAPAPSRRGASVVRDNRREDLILRGRSNYRMLPE